MPEEAWGRRSVNGCFRLGGMGGIAGGRADTEGFCAGMPGLDGIHGAVHPGPYTLVQHY